MSYVKENLSPGESIVGRARVHWSVVLFATIRSGVVMAVAVAIYAYRQDLGGLFGQNTAVATDVCKYLGLSVGAIVAMRWVGFLGDVWAVEYVVTNQKLVVKRGVVLRRSAEMRLSKIESLEIRQGLLGRIFASGRVVATGTGGSVRPAYRISRPLAFKKKIEHAIEARLANGVA